MALALRNHPSNKCSKTKRRLSKRRANSTNAAKYKRRSPCTQTRCSRFASDSLLRDLIAIIPYQPRRAPRRPKLGQVALTDMYATSSREPGIAARARRRQCGASPESQFSRLFLRRWLPAFNIRFHCGRVLFQLLDVQSTSALAAPSTDQSDSGSAACGGDQGEYLFSGHSV